MSKKIACGIPAFKAHKTLPTLLSSIQTQTMKDEIKVYIINDDPNGDDYSEIIKNYPELEIEEIRLEKNGGPGVARNKAIEAAKEDCIFFCDADDVLYHPFAIETLYRGLCQPNTIQCQGIFVQPVNTPEGIKLYPHKEPTHPWSFGRLTNLKFLQQNNINFGTLRAMEDGRFQWCIRLLIEGTNLKINYVNDISYVWKEGSEHSITRIGTDVNDGIPVYNYGLCQIGAAIAAKQAIDFAREKNPFNGNISKFAVEQMVGLYFTYYEAIEKCPKFAEQLLWLAKWFYNNCYKANCQNVTDDILDKFYMAMLGIKGPSLVHFPELTFKQWFDKVSNEEFNIDELEEIRKKLPEDIVKAEKKSGVLGNNIFEMLK